MASIQPDTHSFVVKVWLEPAAGKRGGATWRGRITHVPSKHTRSFTDLDEIAAFIAPYLAGAPAPAGGRRRWWARLRRALAARK